MTGELPKIIIVCGPTASGKTSLGIELAEALDGEIVGADSLQLYRYFDVGTAKPTNEQRQRVPHHLVDVRDPTELFNAALYKTLADEAIEGIRSRGRVPIVVGGTGLYLRILVRGIFQAPKPDEVLRERLKQELEVYGIEHLYNRLKLVDPELASKVEHHDRNRIIRGLEIYEQTGIPLSEHQRVHDFDRPSYQAFRLGMRLERSELYDRITRRTASMMDAGLLAECESLIARGYGGDIKPMQSLGYRQLHRHLTEGQPLDEAVQEITKETKRYAKRQLTWFRKDTQTHWVDALNVPVDQLVADARRFLNGEPMSLDWAAEAP